MSIYFSLFSADVCFYFTRLVALKGNLTKTPLYVITPTYSRPSQRAELTRVSQALSGVENVVWIVVEDSQDKTLRVREFLSKVTELRSGRWKSNYCWGMSTLTRHLSVHLATSNQTFSDGKANKNTPKGVFCRNTALEWLIENNCQTGVFYFADDDNTYDTEVFNELVNINKKSIIGLLPVGLLGYMKYNGPVVKNGKIQQGREGVLQWKRRHMILILWAPYLCIFSDSL